MSKESGSTSLRERLVLSFLVSPGLAIWVGWVAGETASNFEGASGYAFVYVGLLAALAFFLLGLLPWPLKIWRLVAIASAPGWLLLIGFYLFL